jgi:hypothetical protein
VRRYFYAGILTFCVLTDIANKKIRFSKVLLLAPFAFLLSSDIYHWLLPKPVFLICFALSFIWVILTVFNVSGYNGTLQKKYVLITGSFTLLFTAYTAINKFFIDRYMLITLVPLLFLSASLLSALLKSASPKLFIPVLIIMLSIEAYGYKSNTGLADVKMGAFDGMYIQQDAVRFAEQNGYYNRNVSVFGNLQWLALTDKYAGLRATNTSFTSVSKGITANTEVVMLEDIELQTALDTFFMLSKDTNFVLVHKQERGPAWNAVFVKKAILK